MLAVLGGAAAPAGAAAAPAASAFGVEVRITGEEAVLAPTAVVEAPAGDQSDTVVDVPAEPVIVNATLTASASAHDSADIESALTVTEQELAGPYNARALGQVEGLDVLYGVADAEVPLLSAALIRAEAVVVCTPTPTYSATSEIIDLAVAGSPVPLNTPVEDLIDAISGALAASGLAAVVNIERNVVTEIAGGGIAVDALVVTILSAAGDVPLATVRVAHADVSAAACVPPQCSDTLDNDGDAFIDATDPGCHTDGNAGNAATYDPNDDDERDEAVNVAAPSEGQLPRTGSSSTQATVGLSMIGASLGALVLRRRLFAA